MHSPGQVVILLGPPGSGKGTQAALLASIAGIPQISTGEMLRRECRSGTRLGDTIQDLLSSGQLVPDELVNQVVVHRLRGRDCQNGCILDGYPRTVSQACYLDSLLTELDMAPPIALDFHLDCEEIVSRLSRRYHCTVCGRSFSIRTTAGSHEMRCDSDGSELIRRVDDNPTSIRERLRVYEANAAGVVHYYRQRVYHRICATRPVDEISEQLIGILDAVLTPVRKNSNTAVPALA
jgi:adenylate kinase